MDDLPTEVELLVTPKKRALREASLVLQATGIPHEVISGADRHSLWVARADVPRAVHQLKLFHHENATGPHAPPPPPMLSTGLAAAVGYAALLVTFYWLASTHALGIDWRSRGLGISGPAHSSEVWRSVTSLTLHADVPHLMGNILLGGFLVAFTCQVLGTGVGVWAILLAGALGNQLEGLMRIGVHRSLGASTAVFGALGVIAAAQWRLNGLHGRKRIEMIAPIAVSIVLLGWFGMSGERTNYLAHCTGLAAGFAMGAYLGGNRLRGNFGNLVQKHLVALALTLIAVCWGLALR